MMTIILENAGETVLLEGEAAEKYLAKKQAEKEAAEHKRDLRYGVTTDSDYNDIPGSRTPQGKANRAEVIATKARQDAVNAKPSREEELANKYPDAVPQKIKDQAQANKDKRFAKADATENERLNQASNNGSIRCGDIRYGYSGWGKNNTAEALDAKARHERRHGPKTECGDGC